VEKKGGRLMEGLKKRGGKKEKNGLSPSSKQTPGEGKGGQRLWKGEVREGVRGRESTQLV